MSETVTCIVCKEQLENITYEGAENNVQPVNGLHFETYGHYGSTIFDPVIAPLRLDIVVCDDCVMKNLECVHGTGKAELLIEEGKYKICGTCGGDCGQC